MTYHNKITKRAIYVCIWNNVEKVNNTIPNEIKEITIGNRDIVSTPMIKKIKQEYHFSKTIDRIASEIACFGSCTEEINGKWVFFGEYPLGF